MLSLTKKTEYALLSLSHLSQDPDSLCSAREIASAYRLPLPVLMNVLKRLAQIGLIKSTRGARGGYRLAVSPSKIILRDLVLSMEGVIRLVQCADETNGELCDIAEHCPIKTPLLRLQDRLERFLAGLSVADVIATESGVAIESQCTKECIKEHSDETSLSG